MAATSNTGHTFISLTNGTNYTFQVRAVNAIGNGTAAFASAIPVTTPSVPLNFTATPGNAQAVLSWTEPANNGGSAITGYQVSSDNGATWVAATSDTGHTFIGLTNGTLYTFSVRALNTAGAGAESTQTAAPVPSTVSFDTRAPAVNNPASVTVDMGQPYGALPALTVPAVPGVTVTFNGWWTAITGGTQVTNITNVTIIVDHTLFARWTFTAGSGAYSVGDVGPGTGRIFYVADGQQGRPLGFTVEGYTGTTGSFASYIAYYLEAATEDSVTAEWGASGTLISGVTTYTSPLDVLSNRIGNGRKDTLTIVAHLAGTTETGKAAQVAAAASYGGRNDWFLPSSGELFLLYEQRDLQDISITSGWFWSSSQYGDNYSWYHNFNNGNQLTNVNFFSISVRAVRAF